MIEYFGGGSPNGLKVEMMLEELGLPYSMHKVDTLKGQQYTPEFLKMNPIGKYPVIIDKDGPSEGRPIFESGAILMYLADTYNSEFLPASGPERWQTIQWLIAQVAWVGPMFGQHWHFILHKDEANSYAADRYRNQSKKVYDVLEGRLAETAFIAGNSYSVADIATFPWMNLTPEAGFEWKDYPRLHDWFTGIAERPAAVHTLNKLKVYSKDFANFIENNSKEVVTNAFDVFFGRNGSEHRKPDFGTFFDSYAKE